MPRIVGPNGLSMPVSEDVAASLLRHPEGEYVLDEPAEKEPAKKAAAKPSKK